MTTETTETNTTTTGIALTDVAAAKVAANLKQQEHRQITHQRYREVVLQAFGQLQRSIKVVQIITQLLLQGRISSRKSSHNLKQLDFPQMFTQ